MDKGSEIKLVEQPDIRIDFQGSIVDRFHHDSPVL